MLAPPLRIHSCRVKWSPDSADTTESGTTATWLEPLKEKTREESEEGSVGRAEVQLAAGDGGGRRSTSPRTAPARNHQRPVMLKKGSHTGSTHSETRAHRTAVARIGRSSCLGRSLSQCGPSAALRWPGCSTPSPRRSPGAGWETGGCSPTRGCIPHAWSILKQKYCDIPDFFFSKKLQYSWTLCLDYTDEWH